MRGSRLAFVVALALSMPAAAQDFARALADPQSAGVWFSPVISFDDIESGAAAGALDAMLDGPPAEDGLSYRTELYCFVRGDDAMADAECARQTPRLNAILDRLERHRAVLSRIADRMTLFALNRGLPTPEGGVADDVEGFRFLMAREDAAPAPPPADPERDATLAGQDGAAPPSPVPAGPEWDAGTSAPVARNARIRLHPAYAPHTLTLVEPDRPPVDAIAVDFWMSSHRVAETGVAETLLSVMGEEAPIFAVHLTPERDGLAVSDGSGAEIYVVPHRIAPRRPYHVSIRSRRDETEIYIDSALAGRLDVGVTGGQRAVSVTLGALADGRAPFDGYLGAVTLWSAYLDASLPYFVVGAADGLPSSNEPHLRLATTASGADGFALVETPPVPLPREGWWRPRAQGVARILNHAEFAAGEAPPNFSATHQAIDAIRRGETPLAPAERRAAALLPPGVAELGEHPLFTHDPLYRLRLDGGIDPDRLAPTDREGDPLTPWPNRGGGGVSALDIAVDADFLSGMGVVICGAGAAPYVHVAPQPDEGAPLQAAARAECDRPAADRRQDWVWLAEDEQIRGLSHRYLEDGRVADLTIHTSRRALGPFAARARREGGMDPPGEVRRLWLDPGAPFVGFAAAGEDGMRALGFRSPDRLRTSGVTLSGENGESLRFRNHGEPGLYLAEAPSPLAPHGRARLRVLSDRLIEITGVDGAIDPVIGLRPLTLELVDERPRAAATATYDDTFVALSKAVNLQANYAGYDLIAMDPIHLIQTGAPSPVFRQPSGETHEYYDYNRTFVPRGLIYAPEFTGEMRKEVRETTTYAEFKDAVGSSVSVGLSSKALPSFSMSATMRSARETISERRQTRTIGFARAIFYDLILDKTAIRLDEAFVGRVGRLAVDGDYEGFIGSFGTHYAAAVVYGGLGVLEIDADQTTRATLLQKGVETKLEASLTLDAETQTSLTVGTSETRDSTRQFRSTVGTENQRFYWVGGAHVGLTGESWSVGTDGVVPIHVALRPIDELLSPALFPDPDIHLRVRFALRDAAAAHLAAHAPLEQALNAPAEQGFVEFRIDALLCGEPPPRERESWGWLDPRTRSLVYPDTTESVRPFAAMVYPLVNLAAYDANGKPLHDFDAPPPAAAPAAGGRDEGPDAAAEAQERPISALCNAQDDIMARSPALQAAATARFFLPAAQVADGAVLEIDDRRDAEYEVLTRRISDGMTTEDAVEEGVLDGLTLGLKILWDEYVSKQGSKVVDLYRKSQSPDRRALSPQAARRILRMRDLLCPEAGRCDRVTREEVRAQSGRWVSGSLWLTPPAANCEHCATYLLRYSARYVE